jgi:hypothetical protein
MIHVQPQLHRATVGTCLEGYSVRYNTPVVPASTFLERSIAPVHVCTRTIILPEAILAGGGIV